MLTVILSEAKRRSSALIRAVEEDGETVIIRRHGREVAEIVPRRRRRGKAVRRLIPGPALRVKFAPGYDPAEPAAADEWPEDCR